MFLLSLRSDKQSGDLHHRGRQPTGRVCKLKKIIGRIESESSLVHRMNDDGISCRFTAKRAGEGVH